MFGFIHFGFVAAFAVAGGASSATAAELCIEDWSTARPVVKEERLATVEAVTGLAQGRIKGDVVKVTLCQQGQRWVYRLLVRGPGGKHAPVYVDAKEPFAR
ncbi:MAG: hypothetical protein C0519_11730 [Hyphomicrobium sp.]|jgi:uncharacterized membrane protein YkoI|nr:hypothetical protein [Hyphomicrobium sp.]PPD07234.1 MAG: hypothetical protein CTY28_10695 [Hyphomicrobium sp.]